jgi:hypothetical protein
MTKIKIDKYIEHLKSFGDIKDDNIKDICIRIYGEKEYDEYKNGLGVFGI